MLRMHPRYQVHARRTGDAHTRHGRAHGRTRRADDGRSIVRPTYVARFAYTAYLPLIILRT
jgi:hypothetical protein